MVKANAYGHGLVRTGQHFLSAGAYCLGVVFIEEAIKLRQAGITSPIITTSPFATSQLGLYFENDIGITVTSIPALQDVIDAANTNKTIANIHLKIDTGMGRVGIPHTEAQKLLKEAHQAKNCNVVSVFSHFASADKEDLSYTYLQLERFNQVIDFYRKHDIKPPLFHFANSAAIMRIPESHFDLVRPGIMLYGYHPSENSKPEADLLPALSWRGKVMFSKMVPKGDSVSYGQTWFAPEDSRVVTVSLGYADGVSRNLSNKGEVLIHGERYPMVGTVTMDQIVINLGKDEVSVGDEVLLLGKQEEEEITADEPASKLGTINYEILTSIGSRVPRIYIARKGTVKS
jgi:alanine racemase